MTDIDREAGDGSKATANLSPRAAITNYMAGMFTASNITAQFRFAFHP